MSTNHSSSDRVPVVAIGASAGGLEACKDLFAALPADTGMAFIFIQHLEPNHESSLPAIVSQVTAMPVRHVRDGDMIQPNHVYVVPPNTALAIEGNELHLAPRGSGANQYYPIDSFFKNLASERDSAAIGVILSGNGSDGSNGIREIKCAGGATFAQSTESAKFASMPQNAILTGTIDFVLSPEKIAAQLARFGNHPYLRNHQQDSASNGDAEESVAKILGLVQQTTRVNFSEYKQNTIRRRLARRMLLLEIPTENEYLEHLRANPSEIENLYRDLLINVTHFFREPVMFTALAKHLRQQLETKKKDEPYRIWIPACASGEEAYSLAILVTEVMEASNHLAPLQLFGTDIADKMIEIARAGNYPESIEKDISAERLKQFFYRTETGYRISKIIRENCIFAKHDLTRDPPFSQIDLVSCRNLLIYLGTTVQQRILPTLHYSLQENGLLVLGIAESITGRSDLFETLDAENKLFKRKSSSSRFTLNVPDTRNPEKGLQVQQSKPIQLISTPTELELKSNRILHKLYSPPGITVNESMQIIHFYGSTSPFLEPRSGEASLNLFRIANRNILSPLRKVLDTASITLQEAVETGVRLEAEGEIREFSIRTIPIKDGDHLYFLVMFENSEPVSSSNSVNSDGVEPIMDGKLSQVRHELDDTRDYLRKMIERHEVAMEELRAANEEVRSSNEEMQSTNEELRTAKEELQSTNEELITVNEELKSRNDELSLLNNDLSNVLNAVNIPIIMVGMDLKIRRYTPAASRLASILPSDIGRHVAELQYNFSIPDLPEMLTRCIQTLETLQTKVLSRQGRWHAIEIRPYRTLDDRIDGAVVSFIDVDDLTRSLETAEASRDFAEGVLDSVQHPLLVLDNKFNIHRATTAFYKVFHVPSPMITNQNLFSILDGCFQVPQLIKLLDLALSQDGGVRELDLEVDLPETGRRHLRFHGRQIHYRQQDNKILLSIEDVSDRREAAEIQYRRIFESAKDGIIVIDGDTGLITDVNPYFIEFSRYAKSEFIGNSLAQVAPFRSDPQMRDVFSIAMDKGMIRRDSVNMIGADGRKSVVELIANKYRVKDSVFVQLNVRDVTEKRRIEEDLRRSNLDLQQFAFAASHDLQEPLRNVINHVQLLKMQFGDRLGDAAGESMQFITSSASRMQQMVLALLSYAQTSRAEMIIELTAAESVLATVLSNLQLAIHSTNALITFDHLPTVMMDKTQLLQLFQNLISNALKYKSSETPKIHISAHQEGSAWVFSVRDNGIGIDPRFFDHVFTVFKRLHGQEYPGTGIGLATCKKIVERHGGRIWVESEPGKGSTFYFTIHIPAEVTESRQ